MNLRTQAPVFLTPTFSHYFSLLPGHHHIKYSDPHSLPAMMTWNHAPKSVFPLCCFLRCSSQQGKVRYPCSTFCPALQKPHQGMCSLEHLSLLIWLPVAVPSPPLAASGAEFWGVWLRESYGLSRDSPHCPHPWLQNFDSDLTAGGRQALKQRSGVVSQNNQFHLQHAGSSGFKATEFTVKRLKRQIDACTTQIKCKPISFAGKGNLGRRQIRRVLWGHNNYLTMISVNQSSIGG